MHKYQNKTWLKKQYVEKKRSFGDIARECDTYPATVRVWVLRFGIKLRSLSEAQRGRNNGAWIDSPIKKKSVFVREYVKNNLSLREIAKKYGLALRTVARWRDIHDISPKTEEKFKYKRGKDHPCYIHGRGGKPKDCEDCGVPILAKSSVCNICKAKRYSGKGNPNYKGIADVMALVRQWTAVYWRPKIFKRDAYSCTCCGDSRGGDLNAHHIRPLSEIVQAIIRRNGLSLDSARKRLRAVNVITKSRLVRALNNGITLCEVCHKKEHLK